MLEGGFIRKQKHPSLDLYIYNYSEKAQFSKMWNTATLACRGLIVDGEGNIVARPFPKFFNWEEPKPKGKKFQMSLDEPVVVTDKMDGSLGILYRAVPGSKTVTRIATRGSFESEQAKRGTEILGTKYSHFYPPDGWTMLFEIIYPENRIVLDYGDMEDLVLLGGVDIESGTIVGPESFPRWFGPKTQTFPYKTLREALSVAPRPGKEGLVVRSLMDDLMIKLKQADYIELHKIVTGLNERVIWERLSEGRDAFEGIPDEWHKWVQEVAEPLLQAHGELRMAAWGEWLKVRHLVNNRRAFAMAVKDLTPWLKTVMFLWADGKDAHPFLWKQVKPRGDKTDG
jgi:RNA ligase